MVSVKECCCGCSLRTGSLILLWVFLIWESLRFVLRVVLAFLFKEMVSESKSKKSSHQSSLTELRNNEDVKKILAFGQIFWVVLIIESVFSLIICSFGLLGAHKNIPKYLSFGVFYFGYQVVACVFSICAFIVTPEMAEFMPGAGDGPKAVFLLIVLIVLHSYFFIVVKSYRDEMRKGIANRGTNNKNKTVDGTALAYHYTA